jgi:hypothetical protein
MTRRRMTKMTSCNQRNRRRVCYYLENKRQYSGIIDKTT